MGIETKVAAGSVTAVVTGLLTWALVTFVPMFRTGLPPQLATFLPIAVGWALSTAAGYLAPHTPRPATGATSYTINVKDASGDAGTRAADALKQAVRNQPPTGGM